jgi:hypothetical protein
MHRVDVGIVGQLSDDRHESDDGRNGVDEITDDDEQQEPSVVTTAPVLMVRNFLPSGQAA